MCYNDLVAEQALEKVMYYVFILLAIQTIYLADVTAAYFFEDTI